MPPSSRTHLQALLDAAQGRKQCDLLIQNVRYLDVFTLQWRHGDVAIAQGTIVGLDPGLKASRTVDGGGKTLVPGFIDAHVHVESSLMTPRNFDETVLPRGTTTALCDPHELANVEGVAGIRYFLEAAAESTLRMKIMLSSCVPATHLETNGGGVITATDLLRLKSHPSALGLAEVMNVPGVLNGDPAVLDKLEAFADRPRDGHAPLLRGHALSAYACAGITSCHESSELSEAEEKLSKGIAVWIREGSVAKDLDALAPLLTTGSSAALGLCTDDRNPLDIMTEGHVDHLVRRLIAKGASPEAVFRAASWTVARHYGLDRGETRIGAIAPGYAADLVLLDDMASVAIHSVYCGGVHTNDIERPAAHAHSGISGKNSMKARVPEARDLEGPAGRVHVMVVEEGKLITGREVTAHNAPGVARLSVLERHGGFTPPANAYVRGFGATLSGAIASSVGHDSHNLIVVGSNTEDMRAALAALIAAGGGFTVAAGGRVLETLALPHGGLMTSASPLEIKTKLEKLKAASKAVGCTLHEPFLQLAFLSLPVIPTLKLTDKGLVDVDLFSFIDVRAA